MTGVMAWQVREKMQCLLSYQTVDTAPGLKRGLRALYDQGHWRAGFEMANGAPVPPAGSGILARPGINTVEADRYKNLVLAGVNAAKLRYAEWLATRARKRQEAQA